MTTRRLAAILAADVVGFSSMMEHDEEGTLARVKALQREVIEPKLRALGGRLVKTTGDGFLCEFGSPVEAVRCAVEVQEATTKANGGSDLLLRMGINLGDIIVEPDGDIYGDGVNVAARLEELADPGGVCVSGAVHEHAEGKVGVQFESRGEQQVKNIARPVRVYALAGTARSVREPKGLPSSDKPSIAVLPFTNLSGDPEQEYFADGVVEELITNLSRFKSFLVIARNSSFTYKGRRVDVKQVSRELGVRYVLEGSLRKAANRIRITAQLIEAETGVHVWADRYDALLDDLFTVQDELSSSVVGALTPQLEKAEIALVKRKRSTNLNAYDPPEQEYFADGVVEDIITALSRFKWLFVIARNSSFTYKGRAVDVKQVGRELGVRYVLEGSIRKSGNRVRIAAQLVEGSAGGHLWADRFEGALDDIFGLQDQVTGGVVGAISPKLQQAEIDRARGKPTEDFYAISPPSFA